MPSAFSEMISWIKVRNITAFFRKSSRVSELYSYSSPPLLGQRGRHAEVSSREGGPVLPKPPQCWEGKPGQVLGRHGGLSQQRRHQALGALGEQEEEEEEEDDNEMSCSRCRTFTVRMR